MYIDKGVGKKSNTCVLLPESPALFESTLLSSIREETIVKDRLPLVPHLRQPRACTVHTTLHLHGSERSFAPNSRQDSKGMKGNTNF